MINLINTLDILNALSPKLVALQLTSGFSAVPDYPKLFQSVIIWTDDNILAALEAMFTFDDRVCVIVPGTDAYQNERRGDVLEVRRTSEIHLLIADRNYGNQNLALIGEAGTSPGIIAMKDIVVGQMIGPTIGLANVILSPLSGEQLHITSQKTPDLSRDCWAQTFSLTAGRANIAIR